MGGREPPWIPTVECGGSWGVCQVCCIVSFLFTDGTPEGKKMFKPGTLLRTFHILTYVILITIPCIGVTLPLDRWGNWGTEELNGFPKLTQSVSGKATFWILTTKLCCVQGLMTEQSQLLSKPSVPLSGKCGPISRIWDSGIYDSVWPLTYTCPPTHTHN